MKRLVLVNVSLVIYLAGLLCAIGVSNGAGAIMVIIASLGILLAYVLQLKAFYAIGKLWRWHSLASTMALLLVAELFLQGFGIAIGHSLFVMPAIYQIHVFAGFILLVLLGVYSVLSITKHEGEGRREWLLIALAIFVILSFLGYLGFARILPGTVRYIYYGFVFLVLFFFAFFLVMSFKDKSQEGGRRIGLLVCSLMVVHWILRWLLPHTFEPGIARVVFNVAFFALAILPLAIFHFQRFHFLVVFIIHAVLLDIYFLSFDRDFKYLVDTGIDGCVGYEVASDYPIVREPGMSIATLLAEPTVEEIGSVVAEWKAKDFSPRGVRVVFAERYPNGDSLKVISHLVHGRLHYGLIKIPSGVKVKEAPILLVLNGGGADVDVVDADNIHRIVSGVCRDVLNRYVLVAPSFRGDVIRGRGFCFRSEGYTGDVWAGAAEDAAYFLEAAKASYGASPDSRVMAIGISRGATVGLILGSLTDKTDHVISISTHTDFMNENAFYSERVGSDYAKVFFTPHTSADSVRRRILTSSPLYFADQLPSFEIHQGTEDLLTTVHHAKRLEEKLYSMNRGDSTFKVHYYSGKGHGYDDDEIVCKSLRDFVRNSHKKARRVLTSFSFFMKR